MTVSSYSAWKIRSAVQVASLVVLFGCTALEPSGSASHEDARVGAAADADAGRSSIDGGRDMDAGQRGDSAVASDSAVTPDSATAPLDSGLTCSASERPCDGACISRDGCCTARDCPSGASCDGNVCGCPTGQHVCGDRCAEDSAPETCGKSCTPCQAPTGGSVACASGACAPSCPSGQQACAGACIAANASCTGQCPANTHDCSGVCIANNSVAGCGTACSACSVPAQSNATCDGTQCGFSCLPNYKRCGNACIAEAACCSNADCQANAACGATGACACASGFKACGNACIPNGACCSDTECQGNATCTAGACQCKNLFRACGAECIPGLGCCSVAECGTGQLCSNHQCSFWCGTQTRAANVAAADYQCMDFDTGLPASPWTYSDAASTKLDTSRAATAPNSLRAAEVENGNGVLTWNFTGATPASSITFAAQISPDAHSNLLPDPVTADLVCLTIGYTHACLSYGFKASILTNDADSNNYTGLYLSWSTNNPSGAAFTEDCALRAPGGGNMDFQAGVWNDTVFKINRSDGSMNVTIGGKTATPVCKGGFDTDTNGQVRYGLYPGWQWAVNYDNVVVSVAR